MNYIELASQQEVYLSGLIYDLNSLFALFTRVTDPRHARGKQYPLALLLVLILLAKLCGESSPSGIADWVTYRIEELAEMKLLPKKKAPCHMTDRRVLQLIVSPGELERLMSEYHQSCLQTGRELIFSLDGKTVKGTIPTGAMRGTHLLSLYVPDQGLVLMEAKVDQNEIVVAPEILSQVSLAGVIVIADAVVRWRTSIPSGRPPNRSCKQVGSTCGWSRAIKPVPCGRSRSCLCTKPAI